MPTSDAPAKFREASLASQKLKFKLSLPSGPILILAGFYKVELTILTDPMVGELKNTQWAAHAPTPTRRLESIERPAGMITSDNAIIVSGGKKQRLDYLIKRHPQSTNSCRSCILVGLFHSQSMMFGNIL